MIDSQDDALAVKNNPYLQSRALWNDMYGSLQIKLQNAYRILLILAVVIAVLAIGMVVISGRSQIKPYLTVLKGNEVLNINEFESPELNSLKPKLSKMLAQQFIHNSRSLSQDSMVNQRNRVKAFSVASGGTTKLLKSYYQQQQHEIQVKNITRQVIIHTVLLKSKNTLDLRWEEVARDNYSGEEISRDKFSAEITFTFNSEALTEIQKQYNPLGFYITNLAWTKDILI